MGLFLLAALIASSPFSPDAYAGMGDWTTQVRAWLCQKRYGQVVPYRAIEPRSPRLTDSAYRYFRAIYDAPQAGSRRLRPHPDTVPLRADSVLDVSRQEVQRLADDIQKEGGAAWFRRQGEGSQLMLDEAGRVAWVTGGRTRVSRREFEYVREEFLYWAGLKRAWESRGLSTAESSERAMIELRLHPESRFEAREIATRTAELATGRYSHLMKQLESGRLSVPEAENLNWLFIYPKALASSELWAFRRLALNELRDRLAGETAKPHPLFQAIATDHLRKMAENMRVQLDQNLEWIAQNLVRLRQAVPDSAWKQARPTPENPFSSEPFAYVVNNLQLQLMHSLSEDLPLDRNAFVEELRRAYQAAGTKRLDPQASPLLLPK